MDAVVVEEEDAGELAGSVEVGPVDCGAARAGGREDEGAEGRVEGGEEAEIRRLLRVTVARMDRRRLRPPPLLAQHLRRENPRILFFFFSVLLEQRRPRQRENGGFEV